MIRKSNKIISDLAIKSENSSGERSYTRNKQALADSRHKKAKFNRLRSNGSINLLASSRACGYSRGLLIIRFDGDAGFVRCGFCDAALYSRFDGGRKMLNKQYFSDNRNTSKITRFILLRRFTDVLNLLENQGYTGDAAILMIAYVQLLGGEA